MAFAKIFNTPSLRITISQEVRAALQNSLLAWLAVKIIQSLTGLVVWQASFARSQNNFYYYGLTPLTSGWQGVLFGIWQRWDGIYYQMIAERGYSQDKLSVFFPLYPLLGHWVSAFSGISVLISLLLIGNLMFIGSLFMLNLLAKDLFGQEVSRRVVLSVVIFPTAFFFSAIYPQSLALFLILLSYYSVRKEHWALAGIAAFLAGLTHGTVFPLSLLLAIEVFQIFRQHNLFQRAILSFLPLMPLFGMALFMAWRIHFGYPSFQQVEISGWDDGFMTPWQFVHLLVSYTIANSYNFINWINIGMLILSCVVTVWSFRKLPFSVSIYQLSSLILVVITEMNNKPLAAIGRYILIMFPIFFFIGFQTQKKLIRVGVIELCVIMQILLTGFFFMWGFVG